MTTLMIGSAVLQRLRKTPALRKTVEGALADKSKRRVKGRRTVESLQELRDSRLAPRWLVQLPAAHVSMLVQALRTTQGRAWRQWQASWVSKGQLCRVMIVSVADLLCSLHSPTRLQWGCSHEHGPISDPATPRNVRSHACTPPPRNKIICFRKHVGIDR